MISYINSDIWNLDQIVKGLSIQCDESCDDSPKVADWEIVGKGMNGNTMNILFVFKMIIMLAQ